MKIAVLMTTFNRKEKTISCLHRLQQQFLPDGVELEVFITDDASSDGTVEAVRDLFPKTNLYPGTGHFYWAGGMRHTWTHARQSTPDFYLLLNDDTLLQPKAIAILVNAYQKQFRPSLIIGSTADADTGKLTYGGWRLTKKYRWQSERVYDAHRAMSCDFGNANIMLVPAEVVDSMGILADHFTHSLADYDYTLKAKAAGWGVVVAPGILGYCTDDHGNNWKSQQSTLAERIKYLKSPKGLAYKEYLHFIRSHFPMSYVPAFVKLWLKTLFPFIWDKYKKTEVIS